MAQTKGREFTATSLKEMLYEAATNLQGGEATPAVANGIANIAGKVLKHAALQMEQERLNGRAPNIPLLVTGDE